MFRLRGVSIVARVYLRVSQQGRLNCRVDSICPTWGSEETFWGTLGSLGVTLESFWAVLVSQQVIFVCSQQVRSTRLVFYCNVVLYMWRFIYHTAVFVFSFCI